MHCEESGRSDSSFRPLVAWAPLPEGLLELAVHMHGSADDGLRADALHWLGAALARMRALQHLRVCLDIFASPAAPGHAAPLSTGLLPGHLAALPYGLQFCPALESLSVSYSWVAQEGDSRPVPALQLACLARLRYVNLWRVLPAAISLSEGCALKLGFKQPPEATDALQPVAVLLRELAWVEHASKLERGMPPVFALAGMAFLHTVTLRLSKIGSDMEPLVLPKAFLALHTCNLDAYQVCLSAGDGKVQWQHLHISAHGFLWLDIKDSGFLHSPPSFDITADKCKGTLLMDLARRLGSACEVEEVQDEDAFGCMRFRFRYSKGAGDAACQCGVCYPCLTRAAELRDPAQNVCRPLYDSDDDDDDD